VFLPMHRLAITPQVSEGYRHMRSSLAVTIVPPGVDLRAFRSAAQRGDAARVWRDAGLEYDDSPRLVMVARLQRQKGALDLVAVMGSLAPSTRVRCLLVGPDEPRSPGFRGEVERAIAAAGLGTRMALTGPISGDDVAAVMADATALVHPALSEPFGLALVEALSLGTPVVAYAATGPSAILSAGGGMLAPVGDRLALAEAITRVLDPAQLEQLRVRASAAAARHDLTRSAQELARLLTRIIASA
jgi:glycosyltransferase involved in cell wall biosynthesis